MDRMIDNSQAVVVWKARGESRTSVGIVMSLDMARQTVAYNQRNYGGLKMPMWPHLIVRLKAMKRKA